MLIQTPAMATLPTMAALQVTDLPVMALASHLMVRHAMVLAPLMVQAMVAAAVTALTTIATETAMDVTAGTAPATV